MKLHLREAHTRTPIARSSNCRQQHLHPANRCETQLQGDVRCPEANNLYSRILVPKTNGTRTCSKYAVKCSHNLCTQHPMPTQISLTVGKAPELRCMDGYDRWQASLPPTHRIGAIMSTSFLQKTTGFQTSAKICLTHDHTIHL